ncbi:MAG: hypothetical protein DRI97_05850 [Bacteroidetes bacterium]|nr:MAG: hypothetical protein DRI97_05850 [Bacteroidota bacterium]RLD79894.1 MAG: hypothetical protein DRJ15_08350 [Bacteroidota bacterium]
MSKILLLLLSLLLSIHGFSQNIEYEIYYENDSCSIGPAKFIRGHNGDVVGIIGKAPIYDSLKLYKPMVFVIDEIGDTSSVWLDKQDTAVMYTEITLIHGYEPGYYLSGMGYDLNTKDQPEWFTIFTRMDSNYNIVWERCFRFDHTYWAYTYKAETLYDGSLMFCCNPGVYTDFFIFHLSSNGDSLSYHYFNGIESGRIWDITEGHQTYQYSLYSNGSYDPPGYISCTRLTIDSNFSIVDYSYLPEWLSPPLSAKKLPDNDFVLCGSTDIYYPGIDPKYYISGYRINSSGNIGNEVFLTNPDTISRAGEDTGIDFYDPSQIYLGGTHNFQGLWGQNPSWIVISKLDDTLGIIYEKYLGGDEVYTLRSVVATDDGGVLLIGSQREFGTEPYFRDSFFIKLDSTSGPVTIPDESELQLKEVLLYPNPGRNTLSIRTALKGSSFTLFDIKSIPVFNCKLENLVTTITVDHVRAGQYYYVIQDQNRIIESGKWIKSK